MKYIVVSEKNGRGYYKMFDNEVEARDFLNTEEYDFCERTLYLAAAFGTRNIISYLMKIKILFYQPLGLSRIKYTCALIACILLNCITMSYYFHNQSPGS